MRKNERVADFVAEAEKIIYNYVSKESNLRTGSNIDTFVTSPAPAFSVSKKCADKQSVKQSAVIKRCESVKHKLGDFILNIIMAIGCLFIAATLMWGLFG